jgi:hypothetical protein
VAAPTALWQLILFTRDCFYREQTIDNNLDKSDYVWEFTTGALIAPTVTSTINGTTGVRLDKTITANFSMAMDQQQ